MSFPMRSCKGFSFKFNHLKSLYLLSTELDGHPEFRTYGSWLAAFVMLCHGLRPGSSIVDEFESRVSFAFLIAAAT